MVINKQGYRYKSMYIAMLLKTKSICVHIYGHVWSITILCIIHIYIYLQNIHIYIYILYICVRVYGIARTEPLNQHQVYGDPTPWTETLPLEVLEDDAGWQRLFQAGEGRWSQRFPPRQLLYSGFFKGKDAQLAFRKIVVLTTSLLSCFVAGEKCKS